MREDPYAGWKVGFSATVFIILLVLIFGSISAIGSVGRTLSDALTMIAVVGIVFGIFVYYPLLDLVRWISGRR